MIIFHIGYLLIGYLFTCILIYVINSNPGRVRFDETVDHLFTTVLWPVVVIGLTFYYIAKFAGKLKLGMNPFKWMNDRAEKRRDFLKLPKEEQDRINYNNKFHKKIGVKL